MRSQLLAGVSRTALVAALAAHKIDPVASAPAAAHPLRAPLVAA